MLPICALVWCSLTPPSSTQQNFDDDQILMMPTLTLSLLPIHSSQQTNLLVLSCQCRNIETLIELEIQKYEMNYATLTLLH